MSDDKILTRRERQRLALTEPCFEPQDILQPQYFQKEDVFQIALTVDDTCGEYEWHVQVTLPPQRRNAVGMLSVLQGGPIAVSQWSKKTRQAAKSFSRKLLRGVGMGDISHSQGQFCIHAHRNLTPVEFAKLPHEFQNKEREPAQDAAQSEAIEA